MFCCDHAFSSVFDHSRAKYIITKQCRKKKKIYPKVSEETKENTNKVIVFFTRNSI